MPDPDLVRVTAWLHGFEERRAQRVLPVPGGVGLLHGDYPLAHDHNRVSVRTACDPGDLADGVETLLGGAGLDHRLLSVLDGGMADGLTDGLAERGYARTDDLLMLWDGPGTRTAPPGVTVEVLDVAERAAVATRTWAEEQPEQPAEVWRQLGERVRTTRDACAPTFLGVRDEDGQVVARVDLYVRDGVAQVEELMTDEAHRGRGLASALVLGAVARTRGCVVLLVADADDWPQELYRALGFRDLASASSFSR